MLLAVLDSRNLLFSENAQAVYELDDFSAYVWRSLESGLTESEIASELAQAGADADQSAARVTSAVRELDSLTASAKALPRPPSRSPVEPLTRITLCIADVAVQLNAPDALIAEVMPVFGRFVNETWSSHVQVSARCVGDTVELVWATGGASTCTRAEFVPLLKALLIDGVLEFGGHEVALHAAALVHGEKALLLLGSPGSGKTTLAAALVRRGFELAADDVALLDRAGQITGLPLPFTIKETAWTLMASDWPDLDQRPCHCRPDGIRVRYLDHDRFAGPAARSIEFVILLNRQEKARAALDEVGGVVALEALIAEGHSRDERLSEAGFAALAKALRDTRCFRLSYNDLTDAADLVSALYS